MDKQGFDVDRYLSPSAAETQADFLPKNDWGLFVPAILLLAVTCFFLWRGISFLSWPTTDGIVLETSSSHSGKSGDSFYINYSIKVNNVSYTGHTALTHLVQADLNADDETFARGAQLPIHYNPQNPSDSGYSDSSFEFAGYAAVFFLFAFIPALNRTICYQSQREAANFDEPQQTTRNGHLHSPLLDDA